MQRLMAVTAILYQSKMYMPGEELPVNNETMVNAWLEAGTAVYKDTEDTETISAKARPVTAVPGLPGLAVNSESEDGVDLVGRVPRTAARKKK